MIEIINKRDINSKTFMTDEGTYKKYVSSKPIHYFDDVTGEWEEIDTKSIKSNNKEKLIHFPYDIEFPVDNVTDPIRIKGKNNEYSINYNITPYKENNETNNNYNYKYVDNNTEIQYLKIMNNADLKYIITPENVIKPELIMPSLDDVPDTIILEINTENITVEQLGEFKVEYFEDVEPYEDENGEMVFEEKKVEIHPNKLKFISNTKEKWYMNSPVYIDNVGRKKKIPLRIIEQTDNYIKIEIDVPIQWMKYGVQDEYEVEFPVTLDPIFESAVLDIYDGDTTVVDIDDSEVGEIISAECRWQGWNDTREETDTESVTGRTSIGRERLYLSSNDNWSDTSIVPQVPSGYTFDEHWIRTWFTSSFDYPADNVTVEVSNSVLNESDSESEYNAIGSTIVNCYGIFEYEPGTTTNHSGTVTGASTSEPTSVNGANTGSLTFGKKTVTVNLNTESPSLMNQETGLSTNPNISSLDDNTWTDWYSLDLQIGTNTLSHSISGSERARWEYTYEYEKASISATIETDNKTININKNNAQINAKTSITTIKKSIITTKYNGIFGQVIGVNATNKSVTVNKYSTTLRYGSELGYDKSLTIFGMTEHLEGINKSISVQQNNAEVLIRIPVNVDTDKKTIDINKYNASVRALGNMLYRGDNLSEVMGSSYVFDKPSKTEYTFYIAALDSSGNYTEPQVVTVQHPGIAKLDFTEDDVFPLLSSIKIKIPQALDYSGDEKDVLGYRLYMTPVDEADNVIGDTDITEYRSRQDISYNVSSGERFKIEMTAYDSVMESEKATVYSGADYVRLPDIPDGLLEPTKLAYSLQETIELSNERSSENSSWIDNNGDNIQLTVNEVFPNGTSSRSRVELLSDEITLKVAGTSPGGKKIIGGIGVATSSGQSEVSILADRFALYASVDGTPKTIFATSGTDNIIMNANQVTILAGDPDASLENRNFVDIDEDGISISTPGLQLTKNGNAIFAGELQAATGTFAGDLTAEGIVSYGNLNVNFAKVTSVDLDAKSFTPAQNQNDWNEIIFDLTSEINGGYTAVISISHNTLGILSGNIEYQVEDSSGLWGDIYMNHYNENLFAGWLYLGYIGITNSEVIFYCKTLGESRENVKMRFRRHSIE